EHVSQIIRIAEEYYPKVINSITVSGVQQVLLHVKIMEVSRTKLRMMGFDWAQISGDNIVASTVSGLISSVSPGGAEYDHTTGVTTVTPPNVIYGGDSTFLFQVVRPGGSFFGVLAALREDKLLKILAEPNLVAISGRPAKFLVGGKIPYLTPQSLGTVSFDYMDYGTELNFVAIVLGNGKIRLEVRPSVSEIDWANGIVVEGISIPGLRSREAETGVEMNAGQTLAIAGLIQTRSESQRRGLPWASEVPYLGALFSRKESQNNEVELLILVTPELVAPLNPDQVPPCGPGMFTEEAGDCELYLKGMIEKPRCDGPCGPQCAAGIPCDRGSEGLPEMTVEPRADLQPAESVALPPNNQSPPTNRWNFAAGGAPQSPASPQYPANRQIPQTARNPNPEEPLPGFKGRVGYEMLR
ncbi:MAG: histidine kinase, partial [Pirellulales bacterium]|nr:histidine kinase [Pirellulales bacterium]